MRILVFIPGEPDSQVRHVESAGTLHDLLDAGELHTYNLYDGLSILYNPYAETPNRIVDGHTVYGAFAVCRVMGAHEMASIPWRAMEHYQNYCRWPLAQGESA